MADLPWRHRIVGEDDQVNADQSDPGQRPEAGLAPLTQEDARKRDPEDRLEKVEQVDLVQDLEVGLRRVAE